MESAGRISITVEAAVRAPAVTEAFLAMKKFDIEKLMQA